MKHAPVKFGKITLLKYLLKNSKHKAKVKIVIQQANEATKAGEIPHGF